MEINRNNVVDRNSRGHIVIGCGATLLMLTSCPPAAAGRGMPAGRAAHQVHLPSRPCLSSPGLHTASRHPYTAAW